MTIKHQKGDFQAGQIIDNINSFLEQEGYKKERLAKRMGMSPSNFYAHIQGKRKNSVFDFAVKLANILGYRTTYFIDQFELPKIEDTKVGLNGNIAFSAGKLSNSGVEGLKQLGKVCDLIEIYF